MAARTSPALTIYILSSILAIISPRIMIAVAPTMSPRVKNLPNLMESSSKALKIEAKRISPVRGTRKMLSMIASISIIRISRLM